MLRNLSIKTRLGVIAIVGALGLAALGAYSLFEKRAELLSQHQDRLFHMVLHSHGPSPLEPCLVRLLYRFVIVRSDIIIPAKDVCIDVAKRKPAVQQTS